MASQSSPNNPLLGPWTGPYGGVPPFDSVAPEHLSPALEAGIAEYLSELDQIANNSDTPTFENTIAAMERSGRLLGRARSVYGVFRSNLNTAAVQKVETDMEPKLAGLRDTITQNTKLFNRISKVYETSKDSTLTAEEQRLAWLTYTDFVRAGAQLDASQKARLAAINQDLAGLFTQFSQNLLADETDKFILVESDAGLAGIPEGLLEAARTAATEKGHSGKLLITNSRSSVEPVLSFCKERSTRERVWRAFVKRGDNGDANDNNKILLRILELRAERAKLLGYPSHAHWRVSPSMAATPERAMELMQAVWQPAVQRVKEEVADMQAMADREGAAITIEPWDYLFYAEKVRKMKFDLDAAELKPYLQLDRLRDGMFYVAQELFGLTFTAVPQGTVPVFHPTVRVWEVTSSGGQHVGLWYFDPFARTGKQSGAWMVSYRDQERFEGAVSAIVSNNANFMAGPPDQPLLISWDDAVTLYHEFGHALHGLLSSVRYPTLSGTNVPRDFVEFPSQLLEHWLPVKEVLTRFARHYQTDEPIPEELVAKVQRASKFNRGFATTEYLSAALVDMKVHTLSASPASMAVFEQDTLQELGMPAQLVMRHRPPQFAHIFSGDDYSAGYYSYLWADTLTADAWKAFTESQGPWDKEVAARLKQHIFSTGNTVDPSVAFVAFRGRDVQIGALMEKFGFTA